MFHNEYHLSEALGLQRFDRPVFPQDSRLCSTGVKVFRA